jgi:uncharacterized protein YecE (DUF72 family)
LEAAGVALCLPVSPSVPLDLCLTTFWTYIRMHAGQAGIGYAEAELLTWAAQIRSFLTQNIDVYVYFNNDAAGHAIRDAQRLKTLIDSAAKVS